MASRPTSIQLITGLITLALTVPPADAQQLPARTAVTDAEALRLARTEKLDLILPGAMRDNDVDMWIHVSRYGGIFANGHGDPMDQHFGRTSGYLIFTDLGDRIERAVFGSPGAVERIDVRGSDAVALALGGWNYNNTDPRIGYSVPAVYREITDFVAQRDPQTIAVNTSDWLPLADGISHSAYERLVQILGPKYSERIVSAENVIMDFVVRRTAREIAAQVEVLALARQSAKQRLSQVVPGVTTVGEIGARVYYSATNTPDKTVPNDPPDARWFFNDPDYADYVLQRGDLFAYIMYTAGNAAVMDADGFVPGGGSGGDYMGFGADAKIHAYILREGENRGPRLHPEGFRQDDRPPADHARPHEGRHDRQGVARRHGRGDESGRLRLHAVRRCRHQGLRDHPECARQHRQAGVFDRQPRDWQQRRGRPLDGGVPGRHPPYEDPGESSVLVLVHGAHEHRRTTRLSAGLQRREPAGDHEQGRRAHPAAERGDLPDPLNRRRSSAREHPHPEPDPRRSPSAVVGPAATSQVAPTAAGRGTGCLPG